MSPTTYTISAVRAKLPSIRFITRLKNSDIIGVEQEYVIRPVSQYNESEAVYIDYTNISSNGELVDYISASDASKKFGLKPKVVTDLCKSGVIIAFQEGTSKKWWINELSLSEYLLSANKRNY